MASEAAAVGLVAAFRRRISRSELFAGLMLLGWVNGLVAKAVDAFDRLGWLHALNGTFETSVLVPVACAAGTWLTLRERSGLVAREDLAVGAAALIMIALPIGGFSWLAVTWLSLHVLIRSKPGPEMRRGTIILLAATVPMFWSSLFFQFFANVILQIDASLVAWIVGTERTGNMVRFVSGEGNLVVFPACSSLANMSLAFLSWFALSEFVDHRRSKYDVVWWLLGCLSVVVINVGRMSLMAINVNYLLALHGDIGDAATGALILAVSLAWSVLGVRRELFHRA
jgi:hypothetical protein